MCPVGDKFPGEEGWDEFKATRQENLRETSPLVTILIHIALAALGGAVGTFLMCTVGLRFAGIYRLFGVRFSTASRELLAIAAFGFASGAFWTILITVQTRRQFRKSGRKYGRRNQGRKPRDD
jgi:hypothetical protein